MTMQEFCKLLHSMLFSLLSGSVELKSLACVFKMLEGEGGCASFNIDYLIPIKLPSRSIIPYRLML